MSTAPASDLLTVSEAAEILRVAPETIRRRVRDGSLPACRFGSRAIRIRRADVETAAAPAQDAGTLEEHIAKIVAAAPPLTPEQSCKIAMLFHPTGGATA